ncbi:hypothetical protein SKAU_G00317550 [Synaphobranchus kaupii]|uniref:Uncharacterized protein n=1 Tax=Synaphobranchus kaupii TaxID=118154 RepID=A0A9Q1IKY0_SYNKA|nr:hypothetical protein SKAU_G00317550 [Synaphobranchus kaupii]
MHCVVVGVMSRPHSRSPIHPFRSSSLYRRSPDRCYSSSLSQDTAGFDPRSPVDCRSPAEPGQLGMGRPSQRLRLSEEYVHDSRRRARSPNHWREPRSGCGGWESLPVEVGDPQRNFYPIPQLEYAERRRLSPKKRFHNPKDSSSWRPGPHDDLQRFKDGRTPLSPLRFSHGEFPASRYESATHKMVPSPEWNRAQRSVGSEPIPDQACQKSPRHCSRPKQGCSEWLEAHDIPGRDITDMEAFRFSMEFCGRSSYLERCMEPRFKRSSEWRTNALWGHRKSAERAPLIVEHDHGIANRGISREPNGEWRASNCDRDRDCDRNRAYTREGPLDRYQWAGSQPCQDMPNLGRNAVCTGRSLGKRSPNLCKGRLGVAPPTSSRLHYLPEFREQQEFDSNGDVDLRQTEPVEPMERGVPHRPPVGLGDQQDRKVKQKRTFRQSGPRSPGAEAAPKGTPQETLTIKVDMQWPAAQNRPSCFSSDRQLSLDLINVGRQRLDFLPMLEHSGSSQETMLHSGTFAQEIISLVHQVKENYFKGESLTLNERFSSVNSNQSEEDGAQPSSPWAHRRIDLSQSELKTQPTLKKQRRHQLADNPGDLRHDLERRRQERLEGVKITIPGGIFSHPSLLAESVVSDDEDGDELASSGHNWPEEVVERAAGHWNRETGSLVQKRPCFVQEGIGPPRKSSRPQNRRGQRRQQNWSSTSGQESGLLG